MPRCVAHPLPPATWQRLSYRAYGGCCHGRADGGNGQTPAWDEERSDGLLARFTPAETMPAKRWTPRAATPSLSPGSGSAWPARGMPLVIGPDAVVPAALPAHRRNPPASSLAPLRTSHPGRLARRRPRARGGSATMCPQIESQSRVRSLQVPPAADPALRATHGRPTGDEPKRVGRRQVLDRVAAVKRWGKRAHLD